MSDNNNDNDNKKQPAKDNIVSLDSIRAQKQTVKKDPPTAAQMPLEAQGLEKPAPAINLPPVTKYFLAAIIGVHLFITIILSKEAMEWAYVHLGFIPARFSGAAPFEPLALLTPITHMFIHGSWIHIGMNTVMMAAFGTGIERWLGGKKMMAVFFISGLIGIALQFALSPASFSPVIGASGGLSGLFAAAIIMFNKLNGSFNSKYGIWPIIGVVLATYFIFGFIGSPDGNVVAWAAHIGGFLGGFIALKLLKISFK
ncbi:MAG: rhomboid family intramembrane serine protease [Alphaproteobacteria bacterium]|nr:rhomboid family intramembrane serine protease [Alphaproteobacteria bacterium]NCQ89247.1 rhomboid family intramembrane serine protease [Alphaproteobacteria bacterium]NCT08386.1 rhomboid family intramembrane serine protease [Alphaproteobacteria bacterium]